MTRSSEIAPTLATHPVALGEGVYWVGKRTARQTFYSNPYLIHDPATATAPSFTMLIDPGSRGDFSGVRANTERLAGPLSGLAVVFINHQDPDVSASLQVLIAPKVSEAHVLCGEETWLLVETLGVPRERYINTDDYPKGFKTTSGRTFRPVPAPFCHFVGARMLYCPRTRILFSGDLFGSLTAPDAEGLFADESDWVGMRAFHQIYMPTRRAMTMAIQKIRALVPEVEMIAPQHGRILRGPLLHSFMDRLEALDVGLDILDHPDVDTRTIAGWHEVFAHILELVDTRPDLNLRAPLRDDPLLLHHLAHDGDVMRVVGDGQLAIERVAAVLRKHIRADQASALTYEILKTAHALNLSTPRLELDQSGPVTTTPTAFEAL